MQGVSGCPSGTDLGYSAISHEPSVPAGHLYQGFNFLPYYQPVQTKMGGSKGLLLHCSEHNETRGSHSLPSPPHAASCPPVSSVAVMSAPAVTLESPPAPGASHSGVRASSQAWSLSCGQGTLPVTLCAPSPHSPSLPSAHSAAERGEGIDFEIRWMQPADPGAIGAGWPWPGREMRPEHHKEHPAI